VLSRVRDSRRGIPHPLHRHQLKGKAAVNMSSVEEQDSAERLFRQRQEGTKALQEYLAKQEATRNLTAKLRAERLAREAISGKPKSERKKATRA
jgi:hypothetical protein